MATMHVSTDAKDETVHHVFKKERKFHKNELRQNTEGKDQSEQVCYRCGHADHFAKDPACPARGQTCKKCNGKDHFAKMCKTKGYSKLTLEIC